MAPTCLSLTQINMLSILTTDTIAIETRRLSESAARKAEIRELAEAKPEAQKIAAEAAARRKPRRCLHCSEDFPSEGPGHRVCGGCKSHPAWGAMTDFSVHASF